MIKYPAVITNDLLTFTSCPLPFMLLLRYHFYYATELLLLITSTNVIPGFISQFCAIWCRFLVYNNLQCHCSRHALFRVYATYDLRLNS
jgi:hypothetical protein